MEVPSSAGLRQLFQRSFPFVEVMAEGEGADRYDCSTYHLSLPLYCASTPELWPAPPYLRSAPQSVKSWHTRLRRYPGVKVGIIWRTGAESWNSAQRSCPLSNLLPLTALSGVQLFALQQDVSDQEKATLEQIGIVDLSSALESWDSTAACMTALDGIVSVDTGCLHLAGALGRPTWALLPAVADWRWGLEASTLWYPNTRLGRQLRPGEWGPVVARVAQELQAVCNP